MKTPYQLAVAHVESLWRKHGADETCRECINGPEGGCCQHCPTLGEGGCRDKPMACAIWACGKIMDKHPKLAVEMKRVSGILYKGTGVYLGFRAHAVEVQEFVTREVLIQIKGLERG